MAWTSPQDREKGPFHLILVGALDYQGEGKQVGNVHPLGLQSFELSRHLASSSNARISFPRQVTLENALIAVHLERQSCWSGKDRNRARMFILTSVSSLLISPENSLWEKEFPGCLRFAASLGGFFFPQRKNFQSPSHSKERGIVNQRANKLARKNSSNNDRYQWLVYADIPIPLSILMLPVRYVGLDSDERCFLKALVIKNHPAVILSFHLSQFFSTKKKREGRSGEQTWQFRNWSAGH